MILLCFHKDFGRKIGFPGLPRDFLGGPRRSQEIPGGPRRAADRRSLQAEASQPDSVPKIAWMAKVQGRKPAGEAQGQWGGALELAAIQTLEFRGFPRISRIFVITKVFRRIPLGN